MKKALSLFLVLALIVCLPVGASAADVGETTEARVPVVLTVLNTVKPISVTVSAAFPVSVVDGYLVTASNARIVNNGDRPVQVTGVQVLAGSFQIGNYENFTASDHVIALSFNGCPTVKEGPLELTENAFPVIAAESDLPIQYKAKVAASSAITNQNAAIVVFTIAAG